MTLVEWRQKYSSQLPSMSQRPDGSWNVYITEVHPGRSDLLLVTDYQVAASAVAVCLIPLLVDPEEGIWKAR